jgi:hypothetical protein
LARFFNALRSYLGWPLPRFLRWRQRDGTRAEPPSGTSSGILADRQAPASPTPATARTDGLDRAVIVVSLVAVLGTIMSILDTTIVNVAIAALARDLGTSLSRIQWVAAGYLLALATVIPLTGWAADRFGAQRAGPVGPVADRVPRDPEARRRHDPAGRPPSAR